MEDMSQIEVINFVSTIASGVLAIVALALSIVFFVLAKRDADRSAENASQIAGSVDRLEKLFDTLYSDTFSMMRDTYTDMRKHVWRAAPTKSEEPIDDDVLPTDMGAEQILEKIAEVSEQVGVTGKKLEEFQARLQPVLTQALAKEQAKREERTPTTRERILKITQLRQGSERPATLSMLSKLIGADESELVDEIFELGRTGRLEWDGSPSTLSADARLRYVPARERSAARQRANDATLVAGGDA